MEKYNTENEVWKDIKGYEGYYQVSDSGRIKSLDREIQAINGVSRKIKGRILKQKVINGYNRVGLHKDGHTKDITTSRIVAEHFIPNTNKKTEVNHIDEDKRNNKVENLEWVTPKENANHGTRIERIMEIIKKPVAMIDKNNGVVVKEFCSINEAYKFLGKELNGSVSRACSGKSKSAFGYKWIYL